MNNNCNNSICSNAGKFNNFRCRDICDDSYIWIHKYFRVFQNGTPTFFTGCGLLFDCCWVDVRCNVQKRYTYARSCRYGSLFDYYELNNYV